MQQGTRLRRLTKAAILGATTVLAPTPSFATCEVTTTISICTLAWLSGDDFWDGTYRVSYGYGRMTVNGRPTPLSFGDGGTATIDQGASGLAISHPQRFLQASASEVGLDTPEWQWSEQAGQWFDDRDSEEFASMQTAVAMWSSQQCTNEELQRWSAQTYSADNLPMTLDLVGVGPTAISGLLHAEAAFNGGNIRWMLEVFFFRDEFPRSELGTQTIDDDAVCDAVCGGGGADWANYDDGWVWCAQ